MVIYDDLSDLGDIYSVYYNFQSVIEYTAVYEKNKLQFDN